VRVARPSGGQCTLLKPVVRAGIATVKADMLDAAPAAAAPADPSASGLRAVMVAL